MVLFFFQDKEKEQGLSSKVVRSKELLPKNSGKGQREWREIANLFSSFLCCHGNDSDVYSWDVVSVTPTGELNMGVAMGRGAVPAWVVKPHVSSLMSTCEKMHLRYQLFPQVIYLKTKVGHGDVSNPSSKRFDIGMLQIEYNSSCHKKRASSLLRAKLLK